MIYKTKLNPSLHTRGPYLLLSARPQKEPSVRAAPGLAALGGGLEPLPRDTRKDPVSLACLLDLLRPLQPAAASPGPACPPLPCREANSALWSTGTILWLALPTELQKLEASNMCYSRLYTTDSVSLGASRAEGAFQSRWERRGKGVQTRPRIRRETPHSHSSGT